MAPFMEPFYPGKSQVSIVGVKLDVLYLNSFLHSANIAQLDKIGAQGRQSSSESLSEASLNCAQFLYVPLCTGSSCKSFSRSGMKKAAYAPLRLLTFGLADALQ
jgi:hypothetical protein